MAKETHVAQATNFRGIVVSKRHLSFPNSAEGFTKLSRWMAELQQKHGLKELIIDMEPTGHYWFNLANWLSDKGVHVIMVSPATTKRNKENRDNSPSKNDPKDGFAPTGKPVIEIASAVYRIENDKIVEYWIQIDREGIRKQLEKNAAE